jgi:hypothetical protein
MFSAKRELVLYAALIRTKCVFETCEWNGRKWTEEEGARPWVLGLC